MDKAIIEKGIEQAGLVLEADILAQITAYMGAFNAWNAVHNLTSIQSEKEQVTALLTPSLALRPWTDKYQRVLDLGSGGGFPGLVLALLRPDQHWVLVERNQKKANFLRYCKQDMQIKNARIVQEDFAHLAVDGEIEAIVSRGSGKLPQQLALTESWREKGIHLLSVQSDLSLSESGVADGYEKHHLGLPEKESTLCVLIVGQK